MKPPLLELSLLGPFEARVDGRRLPSPRTRKGAWLLALLALRQGRAVERAYLAATLWPESGHAAALTNLRNALTDLRRLLGPAAGCLCSPSPHTLVLATDKARVDAATFEAMIQQGDLAALTEAVSLYRGPLLEG